MGENDPLSQYNKIPLAHNLTSSIVCDIIVDVCIDMINSVIVISLYCMLYISTSDIDEGYRLLNVHARTRYVPSSTDSHIC